MKCDNCGDEVKEYVKIESGEIYCPICNRAYLYGWQARDEKLTDDEKDTLFSDFTGDSDN